MPFGLTSPEMAAVMGALGCRQALLLDGGISGQLRLRDGDGVDPHLARYPERAARAGGALAPLTIPARSTVVRIQGWMQHW